MNHSPVAIWRDRLQYLQSRESLSWLELGELEQLQKAIAIVDVTSQPAGKTSRLSWGDREGSALDASGFDSRYPPLGI